MDSNSQVEEEEDIVEDFLYAARTGDVEWITELLSAHPEVISCTDSNGNTPLHFASANGHNDVISLLLKHPQSISPQNYAGNTPLHWACLNNQAQTVKLLVQEGADMFIKNNVGRDAVWEAEQRGNEELVRWMLAYGDERTVGEYVEGDGENAELEEEGQVANVQTEEKQYPQSNGTQGTVEKQ